MSDDAAEDLRKVPDRWAQPPAELVSTLPKPTKRDNQKGRCDVCGGWHGLPAVHLDYMGHADVTLALIDVDPLWTLEPVTNGNGCPIITTIDRRLVMWCRLTVLGVTRWCVGTCDPAKPEPEKELIGDALRNGAMRFGIGTALWSKVERHEHSEPEPEPEHPLAGRVRDVFNRIDRMTDDEKAALRDWAHDQKRLVTGQALIADEEWLSHVETWLEETGGAT